MLDIISPLFYSITTGGEMSNYNRNQKTVYVTENTQYIYDEVLKEAESTGKGTGFLLLESYAITRKLKLPEYISKGDVTKNKRRYEKQ